MEQQQITVKIKAPNHTQDKVTSLLSNDTVGTLRGKIMTELNYEGKHVRMICSGKLLDPDSVSIAKFGVKDGSFIHVVVSDRTSTTGLSSSASAIIAQHQQTRTATNHPAVTTALAAGSLRGFDRLVVHGLTLDETAALRSSFRTQVDEYCEVNPPTHSFARRISHGSATFDGDSSGASSNSDGDSDTGHEPSGSSGYDEHRSVNSTTRSLQQTTSRTGNNGSNRDVGRDGSGVQVESAVEYRYRMEEEWMAQQGVSSEFYMNLPESAARSIAASGLNRSNGRSSDGSSMLPLSMSALYQLRRASLVEQLTSGGDGLEGSSGGSVGTGRDFMWGFLLGFTLGFLMLFCVWDRNVSNRQKAGIMFGVSLHMFSAYWQQSQGPEHRSTTQSPYLRSSSSSNSGVDGGTNNGLVGGFNGESDVVID